MSIIQTIREKGAVITIATLAIALIGFMLMDSGKSGLLGGNQTTLGSVNGEKIDYKDFNKKTEEMEQQYPNSGGAQRNQIMQSVWDQMVAEKVVTAEFDKLGIVFTPKEMSSIMFSQDAPPQLKQAFTDPKTGQYDVAQAQLWWSQMKKNKNDEQKNAILSQVIDPMQLSSLYNKYTSMIAGSIYQPKWLDKQQADEANNFATISYVAVPYTSISDSAVKITDGDITDYVNKHKKQYELEAGRMVSYVIFDGSANGEDSVRIRASLQQLKPEFVADTNAKFFLGKNSSSIPYFDGYTPGSKIQVPNKDSILAESDGGVFGPYIDGKNFVLAKKVSTKILPDSIKCRHILIGTMDPQTQQPTMNDSTAKRIADSIDVAIKGGASFDQLEQKYSTDQAAKAQNGVMTFDLSTMQSDNFAKEFGQFLMNNPVGTKQVIKTQFGYHYIEILNQINPEPAYKIAYMAKDIAPSDETVNKANTEAIKLSGNTDMKSFNSYVAKNGLNKIDIPNPIKENDFQMGGIQDARPIVKWAFEAKEGAVSEPFSVKDNYIVAVVDRSIKAGVPDAATARPLVESIVRNMKKADQIKKKLNNPASLQAAASAYNLQVLNTGEDSTLTFNAQIINGIGNEPKIAGAAFNKEYQNKLSPAIAGNTGVFVIKVNSLGVKSPLPAEIVQQQKMQKLMNQMQSALGQSFEGLKKIATIKDQRSKFF
ncbi:MAG: SurA N-terminal domain-containing protein [Ginsengibacter sp.]